MSAPTRDCSLLLRAGLTPVGIASRLGLDLKVVLESLDQGIGAGYVKRSDIYRSIPQSTRIAVDEALIVSGSCLRSTWDRWAEVDPVLAVDPSLEPGEVQVCLRYGPVETLVGDLFQDLRQVELDMDALIRSVLVREFGDGEAGWWRQGVPVAVRSACVLRREDYMAALLEPWRFMDLMNYWEILNARWPVFSPLFTAPATPSKPDLKRDFLALNDLRNRIMHPVRSMPPTEPDFDLVAAFTRQVRSASERFSGQAVEVASL